MNQVKKVIKENRNVPMLADLIINKSGGRLRYSTRKRGAFRIQLTDPKNPVQAVDLLDMVKSAGIKVIKIIEPGMIGAASGKFHTFMMLYGEKEFSVVFGLGQNKGHSFEDAVEEDLNKSLSAEPSTESVLFKSLLNAFNLTQKDDIVSIQKVSGPKVSRAFSTEIQNIGPVVSDINIILKNGETIYVSLKNADGKTLANIGCKGVFVVENGKDNLPYISSGEHPLDHFIKACGIDKDIATIGLNDYIRHTPTKNIVRNQPITNYDDEIISKYLSSAFGYGYWYLKANNKVKGGFQIVNIPSKEAAQALVGKITSITANYPFWNEQISSKQITVKIATTTMDFKIELRSSKGGINPDEIKVQTKNMKF